MTTHLLIVRHGNTFTPEETPRRVGARTDIPLVDKGLEQAHRVASWLQNHQITPDVVFSGPLLRHTQTADIVTSTLNLPPATIHPGLTEIDYGPDENQTEDNVISRLGQQVITDWNTHATVPEGWQVKPTALTATWAQLASDHPQKTILAITSNGTARFALNLLATPPTTPLKLSTGAIGHLTHHHNTWHLEAWNVRP